MSDKVHFIDTTLRDGQQSLWAYRMPARAMLPALKDMDAAGFDSMEFTAPAAQFARAVRDLKEDPWLWLNHGTKEVSQTPLRHHGGTSSPFIPVPRSVQLLMLQKLCDLGIRDTRFSDWWNNYDRLTTEMRTLGEYGIRPIVNLIYSVSPRHTVEYYRKKAKEAAALKPYRICFKDVGGLLTPEVAAELLPAVMESVGDCEVEFHAHCNSGFAPYCVGVAVESGIRLIHTAIPPLANGSSLPSIFNVATNLATRGYEPVINFEPLERVRAHFERVADVERLPKGSPLEFDETLYRHQIPGGMISNLRFQLDQVGMSDRLQETLDEAVRVREEFGFPIMVTPLSQFVGTQAALNVTVGERYKAVTDEVIGYALGQWGDEAIELMDRHVRAIILDRPRARELAAQAQDAAPNPSLTDVRARYGESVSDEELLTRVCAGVGAEPLELDRTRPPSSYDQYLSSRHTLSALLDRISNSNVKYFAWHDSRRSLSVRR